MVKRKDNSPIEVSTGYYSASLKEPGMWNDKPYQLVDRNIHADHIAILPNEEGACSLSDGCGLNRNMKLNCAACPCATNPSQAKENTQTGDAIDEGLLELWKFFKQ